MSDGSDVEQSSSIIGMVSESTVSGAFFSLSIEYEAELKRKNDEKEVLASLMLMGGAGSLQQIISKSAELSNDLEASNRITPGDIQQALNRLSDKGLVQSEQSEYRLLKDTSAKSIATLYRYFLGGRYPVRALGSEFYDKNINGELLEYICEIQVGLVLSPEDKDMCLKLLLWSPNALFTSLHPIPMIVSHRQMQPEIQSARIDKHDIDIFMRLLYDCFKRDYNSRELCEYFAVKRDLREVDTWYNINIKSSKALVSKLEQRTRLAIVRLAESLGGGYSHISVLEDMPEPWDLGKGSNDSE
jgi:hypothetical protein